MKLNAYWERCTPEWVARWNVCGPTVRRAVYEICPTYVCISPVFHRVGHEHLMGYTTLRIEATPVSHESKEPA